MKMMTMKELCVCARVCASIHSRFYWFRYSYVESFLYSSFWLKIKMQKIHTLWTERDNNFGIQHVFEN